MREKRLRCTDSICILFFCATHSPHLYDVIILEKRLYFLQCSGFNIVRLHAIVQFHAVRNFYAADDEDFVAAGDK